ncbi:MAG: aldolase, partial [Gammaproteobacteria bacterium]|nr:aldolase [Gammaproteobacteria bacterium]
MSFGSDFTLTLFTDDPKLAARADAAGVNRIGPDLEIIGKHRRQGHLNTRISAHAVEALAAIRPTLTRADLFVRVNPIHPGSAAEIVRVIGEGAAVVMLPMFTAPEEVATFLRLVDGRARTVLLLETAKAAARIDEILALGGFDEMHIGLNDLYLSSGLRSQFEVLCSDVL